MVFIIFNPLKASGTMENKVEKRIENDQSRGFLV